VACSSQTPKLYNFEAHLSQARTRGFPILMLPNSSLKDGLLHFRGSLKNIVPV